MYRNREVIEQISVCDGQAIYEDDTAITMEDAKNVGLRECPYLDECFSGQLQRAGLKCAAALGQTMARTVTLQRHPIESEIDEILAARVLPPHSSGIIDPLKNDLTQVEHDPERALDLVTDWAYRILNVDKPVSVSMHGKPKLLKTDEPKGETPFQRLVRLDSTDVVYPDGVAKRVSRDICRCPIFRVGDFCPVHGG